MKDFKKLQEICIQEVLAVGIKPGKISEWTINTRAKSRWGLCKKNPDGSYSIQIASQLLVDDRVSEVALKTTMIHEILHTTKGGMCHTGNWKKYAQLMNETYGYNIKRITPGSEKGVEDREIKAKPAKYLLVCRYCGQKIYRRQQCKLTKYYKNYSCGICGKSRAFVRFEL